MNRTLLLDYMGDPSLLSGASLSELEKLTIDFPYCQATHLLYVKALSEQNSVHFHAQLKKTAAHISDRSILYYLIQSKQEIAPIPSEKKVIKEKVISTPPTVEKKEAPLSVETTTSNPKNMDQLILRVKELSNHTLPDLTETADKLSLLQTEHLQRIDDMVAAYLALRTIAKAAHKKELKKTVTKVEAPPTIIETPTIPVKKEKIDTVQEIVEKQEKLPEIKVKPPKEENKKAALIEKFIETAPSMPKPRKDFYSATNMAHNSTIDKDDLVSETLAEIHLKQGNIQKAIKIYQRLCLIIPEKSTYFAARIENLKKENNLL